MALTRGLHKLPGAPARRVLVCSSPSKIRMTFVARRSTSNVFHSSLQSSRGASATIFASMSRQRPQQPRASQPSPRCRPYSSQANTPQQHRILVVGGGPAGSATAYFLAKAGFQVVVAERSTRDPYGQGIDITNEAVDVVKRMGLWEKIKANTTGETGFALLDDDAREIARVGVNAVEPGAAAANSAPSPTNEIEVCNILCSRLIFH